jgi:acetyl esterase/lipase
MRARSRPWVVGNLLVFATFQGAIFPCAACGADQSPGPIVLRVPGMSDVRVKRDLKYKSTDDIDLRFDVYLPKGAAPRSGWPAVVLIHGGPVPSKTPVKDWPLFESYGRMVAAHDLAAITFNYRFASSSQLATGAEDIKELLETVRRQAREFDINAQRICLWAFSGGGPQLSMVPREHPDNVRCMISFYALLDAASEQGRFSPLVQLKDTTAKMPPMFIARAGKDFVEFNRSVDAFVELARKRNMSVTVDNYPDGVHGFDFLSDTDESREIIRKAVAFAKKHLDD